MDECLADGCRNSLIGACERDCGDEDPMANPDQTGWFTTRHAGTYPYPATYDWNCDGVEEREYGATINCFVDPGEICPTGEGWQGSEPPFCGTTGRWIRCTGSSGGCTTIVIEESRQQRCR